MRERPRDPLREQVQATLGSAYTLARELGGGGMSRVFVVREEALGRDVVVKVLAPDLAQGLSAERFAREIRLVAALQEPHIVPVLAAGVTADRPAAARRRLVAAGAVALIALLVAGVVARRGGLGATFGGAAAAVAGPPSLAVLPFEHQGDTADVYLTDGITDEIRGKLAGVRDLVVIARASSNAYRATAVARRHRQRGSGAARPRRRATGGGPMGLHAILAFVGWFAVAVVLFLGCVLIASHRSVATQQRDATRLAEAAQTPRTHLTLSERLLLAGAVGGETLLAPRVLQMPGAARAHEILAAAVLANERAGYVTVRFVESGRFSRWPPSVRITPTGTPNAWGGESPWPAFTVEELALELVRDHNGMHASALMSELPQGIITRPVLDRPAIRDIHEARVVEEMLRVLRAYGLVDAPAAGPAAASASAAVLTAAGEAILRGAPDDDPRGYGDVWLALVDGARDFFDQANRPDPGG